MSTYTTASDATPRRITTPMHILSGLFRTPTRLATPGNAVSRRNGKRSRPRTASLSSSSPPTAPVSGITPTSLPAVVLQTYSVSTDSIVLTSLPTAPFCCHEDLLTMSRTQLEGVVRTLNARLPRRMRIHPEDGFWQNDDQGCAGDDDADDGVSRMSEAEMKKRIEELVGIRAVVGKNRVSRSGLGLGVRARVPPAPKAVRTRDAAWRPYERDPWDMEMDDVEDQTDDSSVVSEDTFMGSSPLASRTKHSRGRLSRLAILQEENEGTEPKADDDDEIRPSKRQRVSLVGDPQHAEEQAPIFQGRQSRLIEDMDISGSPLLSGEVDGLSYNDAETEERTATIATNTDCRTEVGEQAPLERRRSARIRELVLKRESSINERKMTVLDARGPKPSILRSKTFSSRRTSRGNSFARKKSDAKRDLSTPRKFTIRLPFASTPPHEKPDSQELSTPRIFRSRSQRLQETVRRPALGRSQSERYPRASDLAFVTINRPRYRFARRKSKDTRVTTDDRESHPLTSTSPAENGRQPQRGTRTDVECSDEKDDCEKENDEAVIMTKNPAKGGVCTLPSLCTFLSRRSRALSTSTVASTRGHGGDSSPRTMTRGENSAPITTTDPVVDYGAAERVSEALGRMAVDVTSKEE